MNKRRNDRKMGGTPPMPRSAARSARLEAELKSNLKKRKEQARARARQPQSPATPKP